MLKVRDVMTRDVVTLSSDATLREAIEVLGARHVSGAPVLAGGRVLGVITIADILDFLANTSPVQPERDDMLDPGEDVAPDWATEDAPLASYFSALWAASDEDVSARIAAPDAEEPDLLSAHTVGDAMSRMVRAVGPELDVLAAADLMNRAKIHRVLVLDHGRLVGIVSSMDITRAAAEHKLVTRRYVFDRGPGDADRDDAFRPT